jgi:hypothetical protein
MKWLRGLMVLVGVSIALAQNAAASPADSPATVTRALYFSALSDPGFTPKSIKASQPWLTPDLFAHLWKKVNEPVPKGDAPDIDGDVFLDCQDPPISFKIGQVSSDDSKAKVEVTLLWPQEKRHYNVLLKQVGGAWKVYDVDYGADGKLTDLLK